MIISKLASKPAGYEKKRGESWDALNERISREVVAPQLAHVQVELLPRCAPSSLAEVPNKCGIYFLFGFNDEVLYIGQSVKMRARLKGHYKHFANVRAIGWLFVEHWPDLGTIEAHFIKQLRPTLNKHDNPNWVSPIKGRPRSEAFKQAARLRHQEWKAKQRATTA